MALVTVQRSPSAGSSPPASEYGGSYVSTEEEAALESSRSLSEYYFAVKGFGVLLPRSECCQRSGVMVPRGGGVTSMSGGTRVAAGSGGGGGGGGVRSSSAPQDIQRHLQAMLNILHPGHTLQMAVRLESVHSGRVRYLSVVSSIGRMDHVEAALIGTDVITEEPGDQGDKSPRKCNEKSPLIDDNDSPGRADNLQRRDDESSRIVDNDSPRRGDAKSFRIVGNESPKKDNNLTSPSKDSLQSLSCKDNSVKSGSISPLQGSLLTPGKASGDKTSLKDDRDISKTCSKSRDTSYLKTSGLDAVKSSDLFAAAELTKDSNLQLHDVDRFTDKTLSYSEEYLKTMNKELSVDCQRTTTSVVLDDQYLDYRTIKLKLPDSELEASYCDIDSGAPPQGGDSGAPPQGGDSVRNESYASDDKTKRNGGRVVKMTIGLVMALLADTHITLDGDGGFSVSSADRNHIFKPITVQAMWSALQVLHKYCSKARCHCYYQGGLNHDWLPYYERSVASDQSCINEWNAMAALLSRRPPSPEAVTHKEETQLLIRSKLKEIMMSVDIDEVTSKFIRQELEKELAMDLFKYKSYIDQEMLVILGQMDAATEIFQHVYLGSEWNASNLEELKKNGICYILNVTMEIDNFFPGMFSYKNIRVYDNEKTDLLFHWEDTFRYINMVKERHGKVLVHCKMGISRSASVVIAYAMKAYNLTLSQANHLVKGKRSCVKPNNAFAVQLKTYQGILDASRQRHNALWRSKSETNLHEQTSSTSDPFTQQPPPAATGATTPASVMHQSAPTTAVVQQQHTDDDDGGDVVTNSATAFVTSTVVVQQQYTKRSSSKRNSKHKYSGSNKNKSSQQQQHSSENCPQQQLFASDTISNKNIDNQHQDFDASMSVPTQLHQYIAIGSDTTTEADSIVVIRTTTSSPPIRQRHHNSSSSSSSDSATTTASAATTSSPPPMTPSPPPNTIYSNNNINNNNRDCTSSNGRSSSSAAASAAGMVHSLTGSCNLHNFNDLSDNGSRNNTTTSNNFLCYNRNNESGSNGNFSSNDMMNGNMSIDRRTGGSNMNDGGISRYNTDGESHSSLGGCSRRPKSWSPDDRTAMLLLFPSSFVPPSSDVADNESEVFGSSASGCTLPADDEGAGGGGCRRSSSLDQQTWQAHVTILNSSDNLATGFPPAAGGGTLPMDGRPVVGATSASSVMNDEQSGCATALPHLYITQTGGQRAPLPSHLQLSSSVKDRISEFETAGVKTSDFDNCGSKEFETAVSKSSEFEVSGLKMYETETTKTQMPELETANRVAASAHGSRRNELIFVSSGTHFNASAPFNQDDGRQIVGDCLTKSTSVSSLSTDPLRSCASGTSTNVLPSFASFDNGHRKVDIASKSYTAVRGFPLLVFDNTVTSSDDFAMDDDVIEIPLSATEEVIPYDPLTMKIRNEQQLMMRKHSQHKQSAFKNIQGSRMEPSQQSPTSPFFSGQNTQSQQNTSSFSSCQNVQKASLQSNVHERRLNSEQMDTSEGLNSEVSVCSSRTLTRNNGGSDERTVFVPNESITWKSGIVKRQKQDYEELGKFSETRRQSTSKLTSDKESGLNSCSIVASSSLSVLNNSAGYSGVNNEDPVFSKQQDVCPIVRSKSLKESSAASSSSSGAAKVVDPFSNTVDTVFAKEEKKSERLSSIYGSRETRDSPSRNNSWGSFDSAVVIPDRDRELPSRQSSWGSCDARVTGTYPSRNNSPYPSRNNSFGNFDARKPSEKLKIESRDAVNMRLQLVAVLNPLELGRQYHKYEDTLSSEHTEKQTSPSDQYSRSSVSRINDFEESTSPQVNEHFPTSLSSDQLFNQHLCAGQNLARQNDDIQLSPTLYRPRISTADLKFEKTKENSQSENILPSPSKTTRNLPTRKVYLPPPFKILCTDENVSNDDDERTLGNFSKNSSPTMKSSQKASIISTPTTVFKNHIDFSINPVDTTRSRSQSDVTLILDSIQKTFLDSPPVSSKSDQSDNVRTPFVADAASSSNVEEPHTRFLFDTKPEIIDCGLVEDCRVGSGDDYGQGSPADGDASVPPPGTVKQQKKRLESWLQDTGYVDTKEANKKQFAAPGPGFSRSLSSCSMELRIPSARSCGGISRSLSEKRAKLEGKKYGGRVKKLTRDLEKNNSPVEQMNFSVSMKNTLRQRSHSLERLSSSSPNSPNKPLSQTSDLSSSSQVMLNQLVVETQAQARDLELEASEVSESSQESTEEISVKSLVGIYEKPSEGRQSGRKSKTGRCRSRPRSDSMGEKFLPPVPQRKSSLDYNFRSPTRSSSQPPHSIHNKQHPQQPDDDGGAVPSHTTHATKHRASPLQSTGQLQHCTVTHRKSSSGGGGDYHNHGHISPKRSSLSPTNASSANYHGVSRTSPGGSPSSTGPKVPKHPRSPSSPKLPPGCPKPTGFSFRHSSDSSSNGSNTSGTSNNVNKKRNVNSISGSVNEPSSGVSNRNSLGSSHPLSSSRSNPTLSKSSLFNGSSSNSNSRGQACSTEMRQKKQQGKTHPLSRLPTRDNGLH